MYEWTNQSRNEKSKEIIVKDQKRDQKALRRYNLYTLLCVYFLRFHFLPHEKKILTILIIKSQFWLSFMLCMSLLSSCVFFLQTLRLISYISFLSFFPMKCYAGFLAWIGKGWFLYWKKSRWWFFSYRFIIIVAPIKPCGSLVLLFVFDSFFLYYLLVFSIFSFDGCNVWYDVILTVYYYYQDWLWDCTKILVGWNGW